MKNDFLKLGCRRDAIACEKPSLSAFINGKEAALPKFERRGRLEQINSPWAITTTYFDLSTDVRQGKKYSPKCLWESGGSIPPRCFPLEGILRRTPEPWPPRLAHLARLRPSAPQLRLCEPP
jgi:hypothetical protein